GGGAQSGRRGRADAVRPGRCPAPAKGVRELGGVQLYLMQGKVQPPPVSMTELGFIVLLKPLQPVVCPFQLLSELDIRHDAPPGSFIIGLLSRSPYLFS